MFHKQDYTGHAKKLRVKMYFIIVLSSISKSYFQEIQHGILVISNIRKTPGHNVQ